MADQDPELARRIEELKAEIARLRAAHAAGEGVSVAAASVEGLETLILRIGADERVSYANAAFCRAFGLERRELVGKDASALRKALPVAVLKSLVRPREGSSATRSAVLEDGRVYEVRVSKGSGEQLDVVLQDVTDKERLKSWVRRYVSADLADLSEEDQRTFKVPERRFMSVSFADLRGFTALSERLSPEEVRTTVNACLEEIIRAVERNRATVDKIVGDEVMVLYGAPRHYEDHALRAIRCACDQVAAMRALQAEAGRTGREVPACGIGVHTGEMVLGNMGSSTRQNYTVLGASVNLAARLCGAAAGMEILTTEATMKAALASLPKGWRTVARREEAAALPAELTGKTEAVFPLPGDLAGTVVEAGPEAWAMEIRFRYRYLVKVKGVADPVPVIAVEDLREAGQAGELAFDDAKVEQRQAERIFGKYRLLELAGKGGMGEVWKARDAFGNLVAVKLLLAGEGASEAQIKRFKREAEVMSRLGHRNICRIHEVGEVDKVQFIAMEYLDGTPLSDLLRHGAASSSGATATADGEADLSAIIAGVRNRGKSRPGVTPGDLTVVAGTAQEQEPASVARVPRSQAPASVVPRSQAPAFPRSQAPAWERPLLEAPASLSAKLELRNQEGSQAGAWEPGKSKPESKAEPKPGKDAPGFILPVQQTTTLLLKIAAAVQFAHESGVLHRDLKPANIMIRPDGDPVVMDFGLARLERGDDGAEASMSLSLTGQIVGTLEYMSPEQAESAKTVDERADVYSLGAILYQMTTGRRHFTPTGNILADANALQAHVPVRPRDIRRDIDPDLEVIILKALRAEPNERYPSVRAFADDLGRYKRGEVILAKPATALDIARKWVKRHKAVSAVSAAALVLLLVFGGGFLWRLEMEKRSTLLARAEQAEQARKADAAKLALFEEEKRRQDEWLPVCDLDFTTATTLDPRLVPLFCPGRLLLTKDRTVEVAPECARIADKALQVSGSITNRFGFMSLGWAEEVADDLRVECEVDADKSIGLSVAGNGFSGYRVVYDPAQLAVTLDTIRDTTCQVLAGSRSGAVAPAAAGQRRRLRVEKAGSTLRAWVDGQLLVEYMDPLLVSGPGQRSFGLSIHAVKNAVYRLAVQRRRAPEVVGVLETGRDLIRRRHYPSAEDFLRGQIATRPVDAIHLEARVLLGASLLQTGRLAEGERELQAVAATAAGQGLSAAAAKPLQVAALRELVHQRVQQDRLVDAAQAAAAAERLDPDSAVATRHFFYLLRNLLQASAVKPVEGSYIWTSRLDAGRQREILSAIASLPVTELDIAQLGIADLSPLAGMRLTRLKLEANPITDLSPLQGMPLTWLSCHDTQIRDLSPLTGMRLTELDLFECFQVRDLAPLKGMPLMGLNCFHTQIHDLSPLTGMRLTGLYCALTQITDLSPLAGMPLTSFSCEGTQVRDLSPLTGMPLTELQCQGTPIIDLAPLAGMPLTMLKCFDTPITDLSPLKGMPLKELHCQRTRISDLSPLAGLPLTSLACAGTQVADLSPLKGLPLTHLDCTDTRISDLSPLAGMRLTGLSCTGTQVRDLAPLTGMPFTHLSCANTRVTDLSPLAGMRLTTLEIAGAPVRDLAPLAGQPLTQLDCRGTQVADLSPLKGMALEQIWLSDAVTNLSGLSGCGALTWLDLARTGASDLSPLAGLPVQWLRLPATVQDSDTPALTPLQGLPLVALDLSRASPCDLTPLARLPLRVLVLPATSAGNLAPGQEAVLAGLRSQGCSVVTAGAREADLTNSLGMVLTHLPAGLFLMGSRTGEAVGWWNEQSHPVALTRSVRMATTEVTVGQFRRFVQATGYQTTAETEGFGEGYDAQLGRSTRTPGLNWRNPGFPQGEDHPVVQVSWHDAQAFTVWLSTVEGRAYRLPTEAEWEYACRAGTETAFSFGDDPARLATYANTLDAAFLKSYPAWIGDRDKFRRINDGHVYTAPVGRFQPNPWGLRDMHGNVGEWCGDGGGWGGYPAGLAVDPVGVDIGRRVYRGGCWYFGAGNCRSACRNGNVPGNRGSDLGFRVVLCSAGP